MCLSWIKKDESSMVLTLLRQGVHSRNHFAGDGEVERVAGRMGETEVVTCQSSEVLVSPTDRSASFLGGSLRSGIFVCGMMPCETW